MKRVLYQGQPYVLSRELPSHLELVHLLTGELLQLPAGAQLTTLPPGERFFLPGIEPFPIRNPGFVGELQERRLGWLRDYQARRATTRRKASPNGPSKAPGSAKGAKKAAQFQGIIAQLLALKPLEKK